MPGWPGGLGNRLQDGRAAVDQGLGDRLQNWWNNTTFFKPAYDELVGGATVFGDVMSGAQPTMAADPQTGEFHTDPRLAARAMNAAGMLTLGAGAIPAEANELRMGIKAYHGSPTRDLRTVSANPPSRQFDNATSQFGAFLAPTEAAAKRYAGDTGRVYSLEAPVEKPYEMPWREFDYFQSPHKAASGDAAADWTARAEELKQEAIALRQRLQAEGYDGIVVRGGRANDIKEIASFNDVRVPGIRAYHGSPHDFERFDASKIGTGEGAQAYGHGLYVAENEAVAKQYRDLLGTRSSAVGDPVARAQFWASDLGSREAAVTHLESVLKQAESRPKNFDAADLEKSRQAIDYLKSGGDLMPKSGHMYEVDIAADPEHFLDWDKPLSEQSPQVRETIAPIVEKMRSEGGLAAKKLGDNPTGQAVNEALRSPFSAKALGYENWSREGGPQFLSEAGIPGIRYLDQGSRGMATYDVGSPRADFGPYTPFRNRADAEAHQAMLKRQGFDDAEIKERAEKQTSNFVVFDDKLISILKKYGLPISAAGLAALSQLHPQEAQAQPLGDRLQGR